MAMFVDGAPAFKDAGPITPELLKRIQNISYSFDYGAQQLKEIGSHEYIKDKSPAIYDGGTLVAPATSRVPIITQPQVELSFSYFFFTGGNEEAMGLNVSYVKNESLYLNPWVSQAYSADDTVKHLTKAWKAKQDTVDPASLQSWAAGVYQIGDSVQHNSQAWQAILSASASDIPGSSPTIWVNADEPGTSDKWEDITYTRITGDAWEALADSNEQAKYSAGIFNGSKLYAKPNWATYGPTAVADKGDVNFYVVAEDTNARKDIVGRKDSAFDDIDFIGFGNCFLTNYTLNAAVGSYASCDLTYACSNLAFDIYKDDNKPKCPAVDNDGARSALTVALPDLTDAFESTSEGEPSLVMRPGDIEVKFTNNKPNQGEDEGFHSLDLNFERMSIQNMQISLDIERKDINAFGSNYMKDRKIQFPILGTLQISATLREFAQKGSIENIFNDDVDYDVEVILYDRTSLSDKRKRATWKIKGARLNAEAHSATIDDFAQIGASFVFEVTTTGGMDIVRAF
ncbi:MAG: hypothetical protein CMO74_14215 [Verrucomicrobiales bacterium]|nr:hypothetical protein [Verrucomicrobiales bacterium]|tara:strand:- start:3952 stop:5493 length:1542 start_codon:yes stop_codon:yes gene_type:complete